MPGLNHQRLLALLLMFAIGLVVGVGVPPVNRFLERHLGLLQDFISGHPLEQRTTVMQKIENDLGIAPWRSKRDLGIHADFDFRPVVMIDELETLLPESELQLFLRGDSPALDGIKGMLVKTLADSGKGYANQLLLLGLDGRIHKSLMPGGVENCDCSARLALNYYHISGNPSTAGEDGNQLRKIGSCGQVEWAIDSRYSFHHYLNNDGDHRQADFWILDATDLVQIDSADGREKRRIAIGEIIRANPQLPVFESRLKASRHEYWRYDTARFDPLRRSHREVTNADPDPFHTNDIDEYLGTDGGLFRRGDLALSLRSQNLILVVRPPDLQIVWYAYGLTSRQHDPDFIDSSSIMVYDNNFHNATSRIVRLDASAAERPQIEFGSRRESVLETIGGFSFHQLTGGFQFISENGRGLITTASYYNAGIDLQDNSVFLALRHQWRQSTFLDLTIERLLSDEEFDDLEAAQCR